MKKAVPKLSIYIEGLIYVTIQKQTKVNKD